MNINMSSNNNASEQAIEFFIKRAQITSDTAARHCSDNEFEKGMNLYKQAYAFYLKAQKNRPSDPDLKQKIADIKTKYQEAKQKFSEL